MEAISKSILDQQAVYSDLIRYQTIVVNDKEDALDQLLVSIKAKADMEWRCMKLIDKIRIRFTLLAGRYRSYAEYVAANSVELDLAKRLYKVSYDKLLDLNAQNSVISK